MHLVVHIRKVLRQRWSFQTVFEGLLSHHTIRIHTFSTKNYATNHMMCCFRAVHANGDEATRMGEEKRTQPPSKGFAAIDVPLDQDKQVKWLNRKRMNPFEFSTTWYDRGVSVMDANGHANKWNSGLGAHSEALTTARSSVASVTRFIPRVRERQRRSCERYLAGVHNIALATPTATVTWRQEACSRQLVQ